MKWNKRHQRRCNFFLFSPIPSLLVVCAQSRKGKEEESNQWRRSSIYMAGAVPPPPHWNAPIKMKVVSLSLSLALTIRRAGFLNKKKRKKGKRNLIKMILKDERERGEFDPAGYNILESLSKLSSLSLCHFLFLKFFFFFYIFTVEKKVTVTLKKERVRDYPTDWQGPGSLRELPWR